MWEVWSSAVSIRYEVPYVRRLTWLLTGLRAL